MPLTGPSSFLVNPATALNHWEMESFHSTPSNTRIAFILQHAAQHSAWRPLLTPLCGSGFLSIVTETFFSKSVLHPHTQAHGPPWCLGTSCLACICGCFSSESTPRRSWDEWGETWWQTGSILLYGRTYKLEYYRRRISFLPKPVWANSSGIFTSLANICQVSRDRVLFRFCLNKSN